MSREPKAQPLALDTRCEGVAAFWGIRRAAAKSEPRSVVWSAEGTRGHTPELARARAEGTEGQATTPRPRRMDHEGTIAHNCAYVGEERAEQTRGVAECLHIR